MDHITAFDAHPNQQAKQAEAATTIRTTEVARYWDRKHRGWRHIELTTTTDSEGNR